MSSYRDWLSHIKMPCFCAWYPVKVRRTSRRHQEVNACTDRSINLNCKGVIRKIRKKQTNLRNFNQYSLLWGKWYSYYTWETSQNLRTENRIPSSWRNILSAQDNGMLQLEAEHHEHWSWRSHQNLLQFLTRFCKLTFSIKGQCTFFFAS